MTKARRNFSKLTSETAKKEAVKEQIRVRVVGFGWKDLLCAWSKDGKAYSADTLLKHLIERVIPEQKRRRIPKVPPVELPSRVERGQLGTRSSVLDLLKSKLEETRTKFFEGVEDLGRVLHRCG